MPNSIASAYVARALALIRVGNNLAGRNEADMRKLASEMRSIMEGRLTRPGLTEREALLGAIEGAIAVRYGRMRDRTAKDVAELVQLEAAWASATGSYQLGPSDEMIERTIAELLLFGSPLQSHFEQQASTLAFHSKAEIRAGLAAGQAERELVGRVVGKGRRGGERGGALEAARRHVRGLSDAAVQAAGNAGRVAAMRAGGVNAFKWHAVLDPKVCPLCGARAGKLWTVDGKPLGHDIPFSWPTLHPRCRCILLPMKYPDGPPKDGGNERDRFENWLERQPAARVEAVLGKGRAALWSAGKISTMDLIDQNGMGLTVAELRDRAR